MLVDWNNACVGNALLDTASWLPSLEAEGGPAPEDILPADTPGLSDDRVAAGRLLLRSRAGLPQIPQAPHAGRSS